MDLIKTRRTIRRYSADEVSDSLLNELLETSFRAPTMGNMQLYSVIVTRDSEMKQKMAPFHFHQPMVTEAPVILTFCADFNRFTRWCEASKAVPGYDNFLSFINAASDTLLVTQTFCLLAEDRGLGTCYLGTTLYNPEPLIDILQLPRLVMPIAAITLGYPAEIPTQPDRLPHKSLIHDEVYHDYSREDIINIYKFKESLEENKNFVRINHTDSLAQIYTDIRYKKSDNEVFSERLLQALKRQGFI